MKQEDIGPIVEKHVNICLHDFFTCNKDNRLSKHMNIGLSVLMTGQMMTMLGEIREGVMKSSQDVDSKTQKDTKPPIEVELDVGKTDDK